MAEILTESYCERCGTKFTFESSARTGGTLVRARTFARGLRNYLTSDESLDDALEEARRERERKASGDQLEAFHGTFNFCFTCRQYTCRDCWNEAAGRCRTCAPMPNVPDPLDVRDLEAELSRLEEPPESEPWVTQRLEPLVVETLRWPATASTDVPSLAPSAASEGATAAGDESALEPAAAAAALLEPVSMPGAEPAPEVAEVMLEPAAASEAPAEQRVVQALVATSEPSVTDAAPAGIELELVAVAPAPALQIDAELEPIGLEPELVAPMPAPELEPAAEPELVSAAAEPEAAEAPVSQPLSLPVTALPADIMPSVELEAAAEALPEPIVVALATVLEPAGTEATSLETEVVPVLAAPKLQGVPVPELTAEPVPELVAATPEPQPELAPLPGLELMAAAPQAGAPAEIEPAAALEPELVLAMAAPEPEAASEPELAAAAAEPEAAGVLQPPLAAAVPARLPTPQTAPPPPVTPSEPARAPQVPLRQPKPPAPGTVPWQVIAPDEAPPPAPARPGIQPPVEAAHRQAGWLARRRENAQPQVSARITHNVWEESTRDLVAHTGSGIQACQSCSLPLSATARFCRRCGSRQA
jgi:hypothetical protein